MTTFDISNYPNRLLRPTIINATRVYDQDVSDRTLSTRLIGADLLLDALMSGDWEFLDKELDREIVGEFIGRVIANAERQGVEIPMAEHHRGKL